MNVIIPAVLASVFHLSLIVSGCGSTSPHSSSLKSFPNPVFTADNPDPARRLGHGKFGNKIATFGEAVGAEFVMEGGLPSSWPPLHGAVDLGGSEAI